MIHIGIDIGGTFTDFAMWTQDSAGYAGVTRYKLPSTPPDFAHAVQQGLEHLVTTHAIDRNRRILIAHGTTVSTNAVITRSGPPMALLTTRGFRDLLTLARLRLDKPVDLFNERPKPLVPRHQVHELDERILADGTIDRPLDRTSVDQAVREIDAAGIRTVALCLLHAFRFPRHEQAVLEHLRTQAPHLDVIASHQVWPQESEYERATLTLLNAFVRQTMDRYLGEIEHYLQRNLPNASLLITRSNGGSMSAAQARMQPVHTLLSGPAAGVTASCYLGQALGQPDLLTMDMGGTSTDMSVVRGLRPTRSTESRVGDFPLIMPVTAIEALGAGGGSIAWFDGPVLKVGPHSAGAVPGPACYGKGGEQPTLTDAYLLCGYLNPESLLGGRLPLDRARAMQAFEPIAAKLGVDSLSAAESSIEVATSNMLANVLPFLARLGVNPSDLTLLIYGGAGGIHGPLLARELGIRKMVIPRLSSVFCAFGCMVSDLRHDVVQSVHATELTPALIQEAFGRMRAQADEWLSAQTRGDLGRQIRYLHGADMRYRGQSFQVAVAFDADALNGSDLKPIEGAFHDEHVRLFGHQDRGAPVEIIELRLTLEASLPKPDAQPLKPAPRAEPGPGPGRTRALRFDRTWSPHTPVIGFESLNPDSAIPGPAVLEQADATVVLPPGYRARASALGDLILEKE